MLFLLAPVLLAVAVLAVAVLAVAVLLTAVLLAVVLVDASALADDIFNIYLMFGSTLGLWKAM